MTRLAIIALIASSTVASVANADRNHDAWIPIESLSSPIFSPSSSSNTTPRQLGFVYEKQKKYSSAQTQASGDWDGNGEVNSNDF